MIEPLTLRDASYVFANLQPHDYAEISCQQRRFDPQLLGRIAAGFNHAYLARYEDRPAVVFGAAPLSSTTVSAWMAGTHDARRVVPEVTRFVDGPLRRALRTEGYLWAEARSIVGYDATHRWLRHLGGEVVADLPGYGNGGEDFVLFRAAL